MSNDSIMSNVSSILKDTFDNQDLVVESNTSAEEIDEWDSLSHIQLISNLEKFFKIRFALGELQDLRNINDMVELINNKI
jgi:acyl carrier protein